MTDPILLDIDLYRVTWYSPRTKHYNSIPIRSMEEVSEFVRNCFANNRVLISIKLEHSTTEGLT